MDTSNINSSQTAILPLFWFIYLFRFCGTQGLYLKYTDRKVEKGGKAAQENVLGRDMNLGLLHEAWKLNPADVPFLKQKCTTLILSK